MPKKHRLQRRDFSKRYLKRIAGEFLSISVAPATDASHAKFSCVVSKKIASRAVDRNRLKRQYREIFRPLLSHGHPLAIVAYPKKAALEASYEDLSHEAQHLLGKIRS